MSTHYHDLTGRRALVTGAQQGIGRATALALGLAGADVAIHWLDDNAAAHAISAEIAAHGRRATCVQGDLAQADQARSIVEQAHTSLGGIDIVVNNAGVFPRSEFLDLTEAEWDQVIGVNLKGAFLIAQASAKHMVSTKTSGAIVNLSSSAVRGHPLGVHYSASKAGIVGMTRAMSLSLAAHGIRVNAVAPGLTDTAQPRVEFTDEALAERGRLIPLGAIAQPADIANVVVFLASNAARFITGEVLHANGGSYMA